MSEAPLDQTVFLTLVRTAAGRAYARLLIESIRSFGSGLGRCPVWVFEADPDNAPCDSLRGVDQEILPLPLPDEAGQYPFVHKVHACAQAEKLAGEGVNSLIWIDPACLVLDPPALFQLGQSADAAVRPVHIRNVGLPIAEPLDRYWGGIYQALGVGDVQTSVESFVDRQQIRSYFNTHAFAVNPVKGLLARWSECFQDLVSDDRFQTTACQDEEHQIFLHQAVLSALLATSLQPERLRVLPTSYNYPYNLHQSVPLDRRASALNGLVCLAYEGRSLDPKLVDDIQIHEPLRSWLSDQFAGDQGAAPAR